jgi:hypothetical protein
VTSNSSAKMGLRRPPYAFTQKVWECAQRFSLSGSSQRQGRPDEHRYHPYVYPYARTYRSQQGHCRSRRDLEHSHDRSASVIEILVEDIDRLAHEVQEMKALPPVTASVLLCKPMTRDRCCAGIADIVFASPCWPSASSGSQAILSVKQPDTIFVFGSNLAGRHAKGAATHGRRQCSAKDSDCKAGAMPFPRRTDRSERSRWTKSARMSRTSRLLRPPILSSLFR